MVKAMFISSGTTWNKANHIILSALQRLILRKHFGPRRLVLKEKCFLVFFEKCMIIRYFDVKRTLTN